MAFNNPASNNSNIQIFEFLDHLKSVDSSVRNNAIRETVEIAKRASCYNRLIPELCDLMFRAESKDHLTSVVILLCEVYWLQNINPSQEIIQMVLNEKPCLGRTRVYEVVEAIWIHNRKEVANTLVNLALDENYREDHFMMIDFLECLFTFRDIRGFQLSQELFNVYMQLYRKNPRSREVRMRLLESDSINALKISKKIIEDLKWTKGGGQLALETQEFAVELFKKAWRVVPRNYKNEGQLLELNSTLIKIVSKNTGFTTIEWLLQRKFITQEESLKFEEEVRKNVTKPFGF